MHTNDIIYLQYFILIVFTLFPPIHLHFLSIKKIAYTFLYKNFLQDLPLAKDTKKNYHP